MTSLPLPGPRVSQYPVFPRPLLLRVVHYNFFRHQLPHTQSQLATMAARKIAAFAIGGAGVYYLYQAGGNPRLAEKQVERE